ncbi:hypothetical protein LCGC14_1373530 [marine sediment metagenome]|uniref:Uncharacterized protein n=1 Tax=marine sediment metagenome TaxID=412755 RepID=A0A0F9MK07_9ZZZZ
MGIRARDHETDHECLWLRIDRLDGHLGSLIGWNYLLSATTTLLVVVVLLHMWGHH